ncbi:hypothetical protein E2C01_042584 [Portunus trituberculatus]|uniref:Uncharacterized protein n=1 Tax=Portunus trituberculatus TaxID=210409 RepID=A0A5B7FMT1_PORTR|nr:hypothetical protein [Portunus trituberculatus]
MPLTVRHLLVECPSLIELRHRYLYRYRAAPYDLSRCGALFKNPSIHQSWNEDADRLAKEAASRAQTPISVPFRDVFHSIRVAVAALWQRRWLTGVSTSKMGEITTSTIP